MAASQPRIIVSGQMRVCCLWHEDNSMIVCTRCQTVRHCAGECRNKLVCTFCRKEYVTAHHICLVLSCKQVISACTHVHRLCLLCNLGKHFMSYCECAASRDASSSPRRLGPAMPVVADYTSVVGVSDDSRKRLRH